MDCRVNRAAVHQLSCACVSQKQTVCCACVSQNQLSVVVVVFPRIKCVVWSLKNTAASTPRSLASAQTMWVTFVTINSKMLSYVWFGSWREIERHGSTLIGRSSLIVCIFHSPARHHMTFSLSQHWLKIGYTKTKKCTLCLKKVYPLMFDNFSKFCWM